MTRIKICGITNLNDALFAEAYGADALGFIFFDSSKRYIEPDKTKSIIECLNPFISKVGIFVNLPAKEINTISSFCGLSHVQLHGEESLETASLIQLPIIRALSYDEDISKKLKEWQNYNILIDSGSISERGGTGRVLPWESLTKSVKNKKIILAGGLTAENVVKAIKILKPVAVDVSSGVEISPGIKDKKKLVDFIKQVKGLNEIL